jgi:hypothetical protein
MKHRPRQMAWLGATVLAGVVSLAGAADFSVPVSGVKLEPMVIDARLMAELPRQAVDVSIHGKAAHFEGVWLRDVLLRAGAPMGRSMHGRDTALVVVLTARDGYVAAFALADFDPSFRDRPILLADRRDGEPLFEKTGPLQLVAADENRDSRWIRQVAKIELVDPSAAPAAAHSDE